MNGWVLLAIGLASLGLVVAAFAYLGYTVYRLIKAGSRLGRAYGGLVTELTDKIDAASQRAAQAGVHAEDIMTTLARLQASLQRLQIVAEAWQTALGPYHRLRTYFGR
jgi:hypothetical protein